MTLESMIRKIDRLKTVLGSKSKKVTFFSMKSTSEVPKFLPIHGHLCRLAPFTNFNTTKRILGAVFASVLLACCGGMNYSPGKYPPSDPNRIEVVVLEQLQKPYEILGEYTGNPVLQDMQDWKKKAAEMGADAISIPETLPDRYVKFYAIKWK